MKINYLIYSVTDNYGNKDGTVANESADTVQICGMKDKSGNPVYFESDAYHLNKWCKDNDLVLCEVRMEADI